MTWRGWTLKQWVINTLALLAMAVVLYGMFLEAQ